MTIPNRNDGPHAPECFGKPCGIIITAIANLIALATIADLAGARWFAGNCANAGLPLGQGLCSHPQGPP